LSRSCSLPCTAAAVASLRAARQPTYSGFTDAGWSSSVARWAHNPEVAGSNPAPATTFRRWVAVPNRGRDLRFYVASWSVSPYFASRPPCASMIVGPQLVRKHRHAPVWTGATVSGGGVLAEYQGSSGAVGTRTEPPTRMMGVGQSPACTRAYAVVRPIPSTLPAVGTSMIAGSARISSAVMRSFTESRGPGIAPISGEVAILGPGVVRPTSQRARPNRPLGGGSSRI
jgi:hypothetical protein